MRKKKRKVRKMGAEAFEVALFSKEEDQPKTMQRNLVK